MERPRQMANPKTKDLLKAWKLHLEVGSWESKPPHEWWNITPMELADYQEAVKSLKAFIIEEGNGT